MLQSFKDFINKYVIYFYNDEHVDKISLDVVKKSCKNLGLNIILFNPKKDDQSFLFNYPSDTFVFIHKLYQFRENKELIAKLNNLYKVFIPCDDERIIEKVRSKYDEYLIAQKLNIPCPEARLLVRGILNSDDKGKYEITNLCELVGGFPVVLKKIYGSQGVGVSFIDNEKTLTSVAQSLLSYDQDIVIQKALENNGDYRVLVLNGKVLTIVHRKNTSEKEFRNNVSQGGEFEILKTWDNIINKYAELLYNEIKCPLFGIDLLVTDDGYKLIEFDPYTDLTLEYDKGSVMQDLIKELL